MVINPLYRPEMTHLSFSELSALLSIFITVCFVPFFFFFVRFQLQVTIKNLVSREHRAVLAKKH